MIEVANGDIVGGGWQAVPHGPVVDVTGAHAVMAGPTVGTPRPIGSVGIEIFERIRDDVVDIKITGKRVLLAGQSVHERMHRVAFVVSAPESQARVVAQSPDLIRDFLANARNKGGLMFGIGCAGKHEVLPYQ